MRPAASSIRALVGVGSGWSRGETALQRIHDAAAVGEIRGREGRAQRQRRPSRSRRAAAPAGAPRARGRGSRREGRRCGPRSPGAPRARRRWPRGDSDAVTRLGGSSRSPAASATAPASGAPARARPRRGALHGEREEEHETRHHERVMAGGEVDADVRCGCAQVPGRSVEEEVPAPPRLDPAPYQHHAERGRQRERRRERAPPRERSRAQQRRISEGAERARGGSRARSTRGSAWAARRPP